MKFDITIYDTCDTLYNKVAKTNEKMLLKLLNTLKSGKKPFLGIENETNEELLPRRRPKDGLINWDSFGINIYNFVRALTEPYPGAFTYLNGKKIIVWDVSILPINSKAIDLKPGQILGNVYGIETKNNGIIVGTKTELLFISKISIDGKKYSGKKINSLNLKGFLKNE